MPLKMNVILFQEGPMSGKVLNDSHLYEMKNNHQPDHDKTYLAFENLVWLTTAEAAAYLRKTSNALRNAVHKGHIHARKFRRRLYFKKSELDRMLDTSF